MYESLIKYLSLLSDDSIGNWIIDKENDGTPEHPIQMPYVSYSEIVHQFIDDIYEFVDNNKEMELNHYSDILNANGIEWRTESMTNTAVNDLDAKCVIALIVGAVRAERFCDGALLSFFKSGTIKKWLNRLSDLDKRQLQKNTYRR